MKLHYSLTASTIVITLFRGEKFSSEDMEVVQEVKFNADDLPDTLQAGAVAKSLKGYGLLKLIQDRTSQVKGAEEKLVEMNRYFTEFFANGLWKAPAAERTSSGGGSRRKVTATLATAVANLMGVSVLEAEQSLKDLPKEKFDGLVKNDKVIAEVKRLEEETSSVDLGDLLGGEATDDAPAAVAAD